MIKGYISIPTNTVKPIPQGTSDTRVCLKEGYDMLQAMHHAGLNITYVEVEGGDHILNNTPDFLPVLMDWLEK